MSLLNSLKNISLHPRLAAALDFCVGLIFILFFKNITTPAGLIVWFLARLVLWQVLILLVYFPAHFSRARHAFTLLLFWAGAVLLLIFVEASVLWYLIAIFTCAAPAFSFEIIPRKADTLSFMEKPWRRTRLLLAVFGLFGLTSGFFASEMFSIISPFRWWVPVLVGILAALAANWWWREYEVSGENLRLAQGVFFVLFTELTVLLRSWPLGYFASAFLFTWLWFVCWLILRFHLSREGIIWKRQAPFLLINLFLLFLYLYILRWH